MATKGIKQVPPSSSSSSSPYWKYDVFLSFSGKDTRKSFTSHVYAALCQKGIITYKDDRELERGQPISQKLHKAIHDSRFSIVIFSRNYASSPWCLEELVTILECVKEGKHTAVPVFFHVNPSEVQKQTGMYGKAFADHENSFSNNVEMVNKWRIAVSEVANMSGYDLQDRHEFEFIQDIVEDILRCLRKLRHSFSNLVKGLVGMDSHLEKMSSYLAIEQKALRIIGICGIGGIGKTTIAREVYEKMSCLFEASSFVANVRETCDKHGNIVPLQEQILSEALDSNIKVWDIYKGIVEIRNRLCSRKVLIVLDDVHELVQLEYLIGDRNWFDDGSRIIITTRDEHLLVQYGVDKIHRVEGLNYSEAFKLFCWKAFKNNFPAEGYLCLSHQVVDYADGLPLAITILGSFLFGRSIEEWNSALDRMKEMPNRTILDKLQISFDGLEEIEKTIFLDIACFFKGEDKDYVIKVLKICGFHPDVGVRVLMDKSLITISNKKVWMHDLLQEMGREIVRRESYEEPGKRSRIWCYKDFYYVMMNNLGMKQVEGIVLNSCKQEEGGLIARTFSKMEKLRLLILHTSHFFEEIEFLSNELQYLYWYRYPFKSFPPTFRPDKLVELHMRNSSIEIFWETIEPLQLLRVIDVSNSQNLIGTPNFRNTPNIVEINLEGCVRLIEVHDSIGVLKDLVLLNFKDCKNLVAIPSTICNIKSLKVLNLRGCSKLGALPARLGDIRHLEVLDAGGTAIGNTSHPMDLRMHSLSGFYCLKRLNLSDCELMEGAIPYDLGRLSSLKYLNLSGNHFLSIPATISRLCRLEQLMLANCKKLQSLPNVPSSVVYLDMGGCTSIETLPNPSEKFTSESLQLIFVDCSASINIEGAFTWLKSYFYSYQIKNCQRLVRPNHRDVTDYFSICLPASEIPKWFNHRGIGPSLTIELPPCWSDSKWVGFCVSAVFGFQKHHPSPMTELQCFLRIWKQDLHFPLGRFGPLLFYSRTTSNQLWFRFIPRIELENRLKWIRFPLFSTKEKNWKTKKWTACTHLNASFVTSFGLTVKCCGFRIVYQKDVEELIQCRKPKSLTFHHQDSFYGTEGRCDDYIYSSDSDAEKMYTYFSKAWKMRRDIMQRQMGTSFNW